MLVHMVHVVHVYVKQSISRVYYIHIIKKIIILSTKSIYELGRENFGREIGRGDFYVKMFGLKPAGSGREELIYLPLNTFILFLG